MPTTRLSEILSHWQSWPLPLEEQPLAIKQLGNSVLNHSYIIQSGDQLYALRIENLLSARLGVDRVRELHVLRLASEAGLCPTLHFRRDEQAFAVFAYESGRNWSARDLNQPSQRKRLLDVIEHMQQLDCSAAFNYLDQLRHMFSQLQQLKCSDTQLQQSAFGEFIESAEPWFAEQTGPVLSHHGLWPGNILETDKGLLLLEWEYAGLGLGDFDQRFIEAQLQPSKHEQRHGDLLDKLIFWLAHYWQLLSQLLLERGKL
ncbi:phosphotransferase [Agaribacterium haliotis]|uniref:phosphotransferase n=1 Tax=Agaribacterium haliotis TaxID=2013869 RepID=UPI000BB56E01|nr:phosphotransferase [Agaribacterium haliotis]